MTQMPKGRSRTKSSRASLWEYVVGALGALLVTATIFYLALDARSAESPPDLVVVAERISRGESGYIVEIEVENRGTETAATVLVLGELRQGDAVVEGAEASLDYVPGNSNRPAGLVFTLDPTAYRLVLRAVGFDLP